MSSLVTTPGGRAALLALLLVIVSCVWWLGARRSGAVRSTSMRSDRDAAPPVEPLLLESLRAAGARLGTRATFVQLSSEVCTPCRRTAAVLGGLVRETPGVTHVELDASDHLDLVRSLRVLRTPTVLVLDVAGRERGRTSGGMTPAQARAALDVVAAGPVPTVTREESGSTAPAPEETRRS